jgi:hypothetical protein
MIQGIGAPLGFISFDRRRLSRKIFSLTVPGAGTLALSVLWGVWMLHVRPDAAPKVAKAPAVASALTVASNPYGALFDPRFFSVPCRFCLRKAFPLNRTLSQFHPHRLLQSQSRKTSCRCRYRQFPNTARVHLCRRLVPPSSDCRQAIARSKVPSAD